MSNAGRAGGEAVSRRGDKRPIRYMVLSVMSNGFVALQGRMNGGLAERVGSAPLTALYSFGSGLVILTIIMFFTKQMLDGVKRLPVSVRVGQLSKWQLLVGT